MAWFADLAEGLRALRAHRGRALSTILGVAWGTFGVVGLGAFSAGLEENMAVRAQGMGEGLVIVWPSRTTLSWRGLPEGRQLRATAEEVRALGRRVSGIAGISPEYRRYEPLRRGARAFRPEVTGVDPAYGAIRNLTPMGGGRFLSPLDLERRRRVVFLGDRVARELFPACDAVGEELVLGDTPFTVVGVLAGRLQDSDYGALDESRIFVPASTFEDLYGPTAVTNFVLNARDPATLPRVLDDVYVALGRRLGFDPADEQALSVWDTTEGDKIRSQAFAAMNLMTLLAGFFTVLVGAIGVGNLMFILVRRRTGELGLRLALGARPRWVMREVMSEALLLIFAGGALGFGAAVGLGALVGSSPLAENLGRPQISTGLALGVVLLLAVVGLLAGWFPARRASRLEPVRALTEAL